jgi:hypothetical protein
MLRLLKLVNKVFYIDPKGGEYDIGEEITTLPAVQKIIETKPKFFIRIPTRREDVMEWVCETALEYGNQKGKCTLAIDELKTFSTRHINPEGLERFLIECGMNGVDFFATAHRPIDIHGNMIAAADRLIIFQTHHSRDIEKFREYIDVPEEEFKRLKPGEYLEWHVEHGHKIVTAHVIEKEKRNDEKEKRNNNLYHCSARQPLQEMQKET